MNKEDLFRKIGAILDDLNSQYEYLEAHPQQLSELELSLFQANADFLSNHIKVLMKIGHQQAEMPAADEAVSFREAVTPKAVVLPEVPVITESVVMDDSVIHEEPELTESEVTESEVREAEVKETEEAVFKLDQSPSTFEFILNEHPEETRFEFEEKPADELFNRPLSQEEENILAQKRKLNDLVTAALPGQEDEDEIGPEPYLISPPLEVKAQALEEKTPAAEAVAHPPTLNEMLAAKAEKSSTPAQHQAPITDLKQGINLNDKLLYIKDLFNGYNLAYAEAMELANRLPDFDAADNFFKKNYAEKNNWAEKQATVDKFYVLLNRRFS